MAVAFDASSESHTGTTGSTSQASFSWSHPGGASARAVVVFVFSIAAADNGSSVTYGGTTVPALTGDVAADTATEPGTVKAYLLDNCGTGTKTVQVNRTNNATVMYAVAITLTAAGAVEATGAVLLQENGTIAEQNVDDGSPGSNSLRVAACYYGGASPAPAGANSTLLQSIDLGAFGCSVVRETTAGQGSRPVGFTQATSDDRAVVHFAVRELPPRKGKVTWVQLEVPEAAAGLTLALGHVAGSSAARGIDLSESGPVSLALGHVAGGAAVRGVDLSAGGAATLDLGHVPSGAVARGIDLAGATLSLSLGKVPSGAAARGVDLSESGAVSMPLGKVATSAAVRGVNLVLGRAAKVTWVQLEAPAAAVQTLSLGKVSSGQAVRGVDLSTSALTLRLGRVSDRPAAGPLMFFTEGAPEVHGVNLSVASGITLSLGKVAGSSAARGVNLSESGAVTLSLGKVPSGQAVRGIDLTAAGPATLALGKVPSGELVRGLTLQSGSFQTLDLGKVAGASAARGVDLSQSGPVTLSLGKAPSGAATRGIDLTAAGPATLRLGRVSSGAAVRGVDLAGSVLTLRLGKATASTAARGIDLSQSGPVTLDLGRAPSGALVRGVALIRGSDIRFGSVTMSDAATASVDLTDTAATVTLDDSPTASVVLSETPT